MREEFIDAILKHQSDFSLNLTEEKIDGLAGYYEIVRKNNDLLHLVGPSSAEDFAVRHILESLTLLEFLPVGARMADIGAGAGLPSIPCLIVREDLRGLLIESKPKKTAFLEAAAEALGLHKRIRIITRQFEETDKANVSYVTCRAIDKFTEKLPRLLKWAGKADLLFFGGNNLREALQKQKIKFVEKLMPLSERRYLFIVRNLQK